MKPSNRDIVAKADIAVSDLVADGGYLNPEQSSKFLEMVYDEPTLLRDVRRVSMAGPIKNIDKIGFASRIMRAAPRSGIPLDAADRAKATTDQVVLTTKEAICEVNIPYDVLEDNIEKGGLEGTIMRMMAARAAVDLEELLVKGDTASADAYLALQDGALKLAATHALDAQGGAIGKAVFKAAMKEMPSKYRNNPSTLRFYISPNAEVDYRDTLADRQTATGDALVEGVRPVFAFGSPVRACAALANSQLLYTNPQNLIMGVQRQIMVETDKDIRARVLIIVMTMRLAIAVEEVDAIVKTTNIG